MSLRDRFLYEEEGVPEFRSAMAERLSKTFVMGFINICSDCHKRELQKLKSMVEFLLSFPRLAPLRISHILFNFFSVKIRPN